MDHYGKWSNEIGFSNTEVTFLQSLETGGGGEEGSWMLGWIHERETSEIFTVV